MNKKEITRKEAFTYIFDILEEIDAVNFTKKYTKELFIESFIQTDKTVNEFLGLKSNNNNQLKRSLKIDIGNIPGRKWEIHLLCLIGYKQCPKCNKILLLNNFSSNTTICKECDREKAASYRGKDIKDVNRFVKKIKYCEYCNNINNRPTSPFCSQKCSTIYNNKDKIKADLSTENSISGNRYPKISSNARVLMNHYKEGIDRKCENCGYDKYLEVAHIKAVSEFSDNDLVLEINGENNLMDLCPNCHKEYDNNLLTLEQIRG